MTQATPQPSSASNPLDSLVPLLFVALWSTGFIGAKLGLPYIEPLTFLGLRFAIVTVLMLAVVALVRAPWPPAGRAWGHIAVSGLLVHGAYLRNFVYKFAELLSDRLSRELIARAMTGHVNDYEL